MKFSLIVPTIYRIKETERLFQSLVAQDYRDFEVIVVDQNPDDRLLDLVSLFSQNFPILHLRESTPGQSHARNIGFSHVQGDIVAFPDDDCVYPEGLLTKIAHFFSQNSEWDGVVGRVYNLDEDSNAFGDCGDSINEDINCQKAYKVCVSCAMFFKVSVTHKVKFNEDLGPGAKTPWRCGDETDYMCRCLDSGYRFYYDPSLIVRHPNPRQKNTFFNQIKREYQYGLGRGYFLATHLLSSPFIKAERYKPFQQTCSEILKGNWRCASYILINGIGAELGYRTGLRE
ncbi:MAG: glycosyltransferase family 2 protein [Crocosphaera sp.]